MTFTLALAFAAAISGAPSTPGRTTHGPVLHPALHLSWTNLSGMRAGGLTMAIEHVEALLRPAGVRVIATEVVPGSAVEPGSLVVVLAREPLGGAASSVLWGAVVPDSDPALWAYPRAIAAGLGLDPDATHTWRGAASLQFSRLLGVVVAHELLHRLAAAPHDSTGLMAASLSPLDAMFEQEIPPALFPALRDGAARLSAGVPQPGPVRDVDPSRMARPARRECLSWHSSDPAGNLR